MPTDIENACRVVAEKLLGWEWITYKTGGMSVGGTPHWKDATGKQRFGRPHHHLRNGAGMLEVMEALAGRDDISLVEMHVYEDFTEITMYKDGDYDATHCTESADTAPDALLLATASLLEQGDG